MEPMTVRFIEFEYYDIMRDSEVVKFEAITNLGTWSAEMEVHSRRKLRQQREKFKQEVIALMQEGELPQELSFGDDPTAG